MFPSFTRAQPTECIRGCRAGMVAGELRESSAISVHKPSPVVPGSLEVHTGHCRNNCPTRSNTIIGRTRNFLKQVANFLPLNVIEKSQNHTSNLPTRAVDEP